MRRFLFAVLLLPAGLSLPAADAPPKMKFNEVKEIAPGVYFRYSSISATDPKVPFGGSNHVWGVFDEYVVVVDANFPKEAGDAIADIRKLTRKPIRYVLNTHHHGDHAYGNAVWQAAGATIVAQANCARLLRTDGPREFAKAGKGRTGRKDVAASKLVAPNLIFDDKLVLDDGKQRVELLHFGHSHTIGDAVAYFPRQKVLCTGDACVNGAFNYLGHSDSASWIRCLERMQQLDVKVVCPGHGPLAGPELLEKQKRYFVELRKAVKAGIDADREVEDIIKDFKPAWYKEWTGVDPLPENVRHVYDEMTGRFSPWGLREDLDIYEGPSVTKDTPGWTRPKRIVVPVGLMPARLGELRRLAPKVELVPARSAAEAAKVAGDADAVLGFATPEVAKEARKLRWLHANGEASAELRKALGDKVTLTSSQRLLGPQVADQSFGLLFALAGKTGAHRRALRGKTMLVVGLGGTGEQIARRANAFGMRVIALDDRARERPDFVFRLDKLARLDALLPQADVVVMALPLTRSTRGLIGADRLKKLKKTAYFINAAHTTLADVVPLVEALEAKRLAGAGLDVADTPLGALPLGVGLRLRGLPNVVLAGERRAPSAEASERHWQALRENVRRFVAGEPLLCVVER
jgi:phosphoglycerate dehydrogenase-like enzyme/glyoxylase-like metal-dependent hydrolase (beta-lactamase superfamily II)